MKKYVYPLTPPFLVLWMSTLLTLYYPLPILLQLLLNSVLSIHLGSILSCAITSASYLQVRQGQQQLRNGNGGQMGWWQWWQIVQYPLIGCGILVGLYLMVNYAEQLTLSTILDIMFLGVSTYYCRLPLTSLANQLIQRLAARLQINHHITNLLHSIAKYLFCPLLSLLLALLYINSKHWLLNNLYALFFTIFTLKNTGIKSFKMALPILWLLFFYDMFWVYHSDVMVTVAKNIELPLKLMFPYTTNQQERYSLLGLGDIIVPGLLLSLCLKYDIDNSIISTRHDISNRGQRMKQIKTPLYIVMLIAYSIGIGLTYSAMYVFGRAQPALVFIVPAMSIGLAVNLGLQRSIPLWQYHANAMAKNSNSNV